MFSWRRGLADYHCTGTIPLGAFRSVHGPLLMLATCAFACWPLGAAAESVDDCPVEARANLRSVNSDALALFRRRIVDAAVVGKPARQAPESFTPAEAWGAAGDGVADDTRNLQAALDGARRVWLSSGRVYVITQSLLMGSGTAIASDGSATLLMANGPGGFNNDLAERNEKGLYGDKGAGIRVSGENVSLSDLFVVKAYQDDTYVIGIDVHESSRVTIRRVRLRGFALAPGIITIRSSADVEVSSSMIHGSCTRSVNVPHDLASFQITGIAVDSARRDSIRVRLLDNVIDGLRMVPRTPRGEQTDGINFAATRSGRGSVVAGNDIRGVDEGIDIFGADIEVRDNRVSARLPLKLIHGAEGIVVSGNTFMPQGKGFAIGLYRANPAEVGRQVRNILIERNRLGAAGTDGAAVRVDATGDFPPTGIVIRRNETTVNRCGAQAISCTPAQCQSEGNESVLAIGGARCPD